MIKKVETKERRGFLRQIFTTASDLCSNTYNQYYEDVLSYIRDDEQKYCEKYTEQTCRQACKDLCQKHQDCSKTETDEDFSLRCDSEKKLSLDEFCDLKPIQFTSKNFCSLGANGNLEWSGHRNKNDICEELDVQICPKFEPCRVHTFDDGQEACESITPSVFIKGISFGPARDRNDASEAEENPWTAYFLNLFG